MGDLVVEMAGILKSHKQTILLFISIVKALFCELLVDEEGGVVESQVQHALSHHHGAVLTHREEVHLIVIGGVYLIASPQEQSSQVICNVQHLVGAHWPQELATA